MTKSVVTDQASATRGHKLIRDMWVVVLLEICWKKDDKLRGGFSKRSNASCQFKYSSLLRATP